jgi:hypothetical protein
MTAKIRDELSELITKLVKDDMGSRQMLLPEEKPIEIPTVQAGTTKITLMMYQAKTVSAAKLKEIVATLDDPLKDSESHMADDEERAENDKARENIISSLTSAIARHVRSARISEISNVNLLTAMSVAIGMVKEDEELAGCIDTRERTRVLNKLAADIQTCWPSQAWQLGIEAMARSKLPLGDLTEREADIGKLMENSVRAVMREARAWADGFENAGLKLCSKQDAIFLAVAGGLERAYAVGMDWGAPSAPKAKASNKTKQSQSDAKPSAATAGNSASAGTMSVSRQAMTASGTAGSSATMQEGGDAVATSSSTGGLGGGARGSHDPNLLRAVRPESPKKSPGKRMHDGDENDPGGTEVSQRVSNRPCAGS